MQPKYSLSWAGSLTILCSLHNIIMASTAIPISQSQLFLNQTDFKTPRVQTSSTSVSLKKTNFQSFLLKRKVCIQSTRVNMPFKSLVVTSVATTPETLKKRYPGEAKGFVEEMRLVAIKMHTRDQAKGEREPDVHSMMKWEPSLEGYIKFLVDSKLVYDSLETIVQNAAYPSYVEFRSTGLERSESLAKDLEYFKKRGHSIPEPSAPGIYYASYLEDLSKKDPQAFICHFFNVYFAHTAGGRKIGKMIAEKILNNMELEFYKWDSDLSQLLNNVREKINRVAENWSREEKNHCLEETGKSFKKFGEILQLISL